MEFLVNQIRKCGYIIGLVFKIFLCGFWFFWWVAIGIDNIDKPKDIWFLFLILIIAILPAFFTFRKPLLRHIRTNTLYKKNMEELNALDEGLPVITNISLFNKNDVVHYYKSAILQISDKQLAGQESVSHGYTYQGLIREKKHYEQESSVFTYKDVYEQHTGILVVTNGKVLFIKSEKGFEVNISDITNVTIYLDAIGIQSGNMNYLVLVDNPIYFSQLLDLVKAYYNI